jgi:hypothetical protein
VSQWPVAGFGHLNIAADDVALVGGSGLVIQSGTPIVVEATVHTSKSTGPSSAMALPALSRVWYFPDGGTSKGNDEYITVLNPNPTITRVSLRPITADGYQPPISFRVWPHRRAVFVVHGLIRRTGLAAVVESERPIAAQEVRYTSTGSVSLVNGATRAARSWGLAEGYTGHGFREWITILNPNARSAVVRVRLIGSRGVVRTVTLREPSRHGDYVFTGEFMRTGPVAAIVDATRPVVVGRTLMFNVGKGLSTTTGVALRGP